MWKCLRDQWVLLGVTVAGWVWKGGSPHWEGPPPAESETLDVGDGGGGAGGALTARDAQISHRCSCGRREAHLRAYLGISESVRSEKLKTKPLKIYI